jgi:indolepyruvate decarboxylase
MSKQPTVADYIVQRLAREGITDCFGVAGDFAFKLSMHQHLPRIGS